MAGAPGAAAAAAADKGRSKKFTKMSERRAAAAARAEAAVAAAAAAAAAAASSSSPATTDPPLRMELQHASTYLPPSTIPQIQSHLSLAFSRLLPAFDDVVHESEREGGGRRMWTLLGIDTDFR